MIAFVLLIGLSSVAFMLLVFSRSKKQKQMNEVVTIFAARFLGSGESTVLRTGTVRAPDDH